MRWFIDTEFSERGHKHPIQLISIGMVSEEGDEYYAVCDDFDEESCNDFVKQHVLPKIQYNVREPRADIARDIRELVGEGGVRPEFWGYFADYDWVLFCQLFGRMIDLPRNWPQFCLDLRQYMHDHEVSRSMLPEIDENKAHSAIYDARWTRDAYVRAREIVEEKRRIEHDVITSAAIDAVCEADKAVDAVYRRLPK